jgi:amino acid adenylation domain-containing protein
VTGVLVHELVSEAAGRFPDRTALVDGDRSLTYAELEASANRVANLLVECGVRRGDRVGLYLEKSLEAVVALYGVMKAGAAYVPLDPAAPTARLAVIVRNADLACLLTSTSKRDGWAALVEGSDTPGTLIALDARDDVLDVPGGVRYLDQRSIQEQAPRPPEIAALGQADTAYILYTSGSTGVPKGVMLSHLNALAFVEWAGDEFAVTEADRLSSHAPLHFDLSVFDLFAAARAGAAVVLVPAQLALFPLELARWLRAQEITVWYSVPSILTLLVLRGKLDEIELPALRTVLFAGEVFPTKYLVGLMELLPGARFANLFGPTETNVCTWYEVPREPDDLPSSIPIGKPIEHVATHAVDESGVVVADGEVGELYVTGPTVMQGYWGDEERTSATLLRDWHGDARGFPTYRTGDLVQLDAAGDWRFLGRRDAQIKSRGYRIELGDVEAALLQHPDVVECAVVAVPDDLVTNWIKAYVVSRGSRDGDELARFCLERLPRYMAPEVYEFRPELPRLSNGKVDRQALVAAAAERTDAAKETTHAD